MEWKWSSETRGGADKLPEIVTVSKETNKIDCGFCNGKGEKPRGSRCSVCGGSGKVSVQAPFIKCAYCKGTGEEKPRSNLTCTVCRGKGYVSVREPVEACPKCRGKGADPHNKLPCMMCRGKGVVTVKGK